ncbi:DNA helicase, partial [Shigella sonnei]
LEQSGEMGRKMDAFKERVIRNSLRPPAVPGIGRTEKYSSRLFDPSVRLAADIRDNEGRVAGFESAYVALSRMKQHVQV